MKFKMATKCNNLSSRDKPQYLSTSSQLTNLNLNKDNEQCDGIPVPSKSIPTDNQQHTGKGKNAVF